MIVDGKRNVYSKSCQVKYLLLSCGRWSSLRFGFLFVHFLLYDKKRTKEAYERGSSRLPPTLALKRRVGTQLRDQGITPFGQRHERLCGSTDTVYGLGLHREAYFTDVSRLHFLIRLGVWL